MPLRPARVIYIPILPSHVSIPTTRGAAAVPKPPPRLPFFREKGHTEPTKWLYRALLRRTSIKPSPSTLDFRQQCLHNGDINYSALRRKIREEWKKRRGWTSIPNTKEFLLTQYNLLEALTTFPEPSERDNPIDKATVPTSVQESADTKAVVPNEDASKEAPLNEVPTTHPFKTPPPPPILQYPISPSDLPKISHRLARSQKSTDNRIKHFAQKAELEANPKSTRIVGFLRPTLFNRAMPRLKPQPLKVSMMILNRIKARANRLEKYREWQGIDSDMKMEMDFYRKLGFWGDESVGWEYETKRTKKVLESGFQRDEERRRTVIDADMIERVVRARRRKDESLRKRAERRKKRAKEEAERMKMMEEEDVDKRSDHESQSKKCEQ